MATAKAASSAKRTVCHLRSAGYSRFRYPNSRTHTCQSVCYYRWDVCRTGKRGPGYSFACLECSHTDTNSHTYPGAVSISGADTHGYPAYRCRLSDCREEPEARGRERRGDVDT